MRKQLVAFLVSGGCLMLVGPAVVWGQNIPHHDFMVDSESPGACLSCHDGVIGPNVTPCRNNCALDSSTDHPVARLYPPPGKEANYRPLAEVLQAGIKLQDGKITCLSCHDLTNTLKYHVLVDDTGSRLCRLCHKM